MFVSRSTVTLHRAPDYYSKNVFVPENLEYHQPRGKHRSGFWLEGTPYVALDNIGAGAFGVVCKAMDTRFKKPVAIKKVRDAYKSKSSAKCALREIRILRELSHENVISVTDVFMTGSGFEKDVYLVMELMETDLHQVLRSNQSFKEDHFQYFFYQLIRGLKVCVYCKTVLERQTFLLFQDRYLHSAGIIHRDLKPSNLLLNGDCLLRIADFGMARSGPSSRVAPTESTSARTSSVGSHLSQYVSTLWYRPPEILLSMGEYDTQVDIWSAGCILAEMLLRREIFPGKDSYSQIKMIINNLGTPEKKAIKKITSPDIRDYIVSCGPKSALPFSTMVPDASPDARNILSNLLQISPWNRSSAEQILKHPFLSKWHNVNNEPSCSEKICREIQEIEKYDDDHIIKGLESEERHFGMFRGNFYEIENEEDQTKKEVEEEKVVQSSVNPLKTVLNKFINKKRKN
ncbi:hypothetical protein B9Z55_006452 [Caenorhabditis nigoni]|uniref:Protein kinase domain-containing protein n=1 Tax=Caenorhabditis nigoni TaxID=1611254 RepID=A0A2G5V5A7_9PELO|nr:hypothetical protein B9Z55_006452 [Caenorhabditis nigoni]